MSFSSTFHWIRRGSDVEYIYQDHFQENLDVDPLTKMVLKSYSVAQITNTDQIHKDSFLIFVGILPLLPQSEPLN